MIDAQMNDAFDALPLRDPLLPRDANRDHQTQNVSLEKVLSTQLQLAQQIQNRLIGAQESFEPRDFKDLVGTTSNIIGLAHRTEEAMRVISTYKLFVSTVVEFLKTRSDALGEDLVEELLEVARGLKTEAAVSSIVG